MNGVLCLSSRVGPEFYLGEKRRVFVCVCVRVCVLLCFVFISLKASLSCCCSLCHSVPLFLLEGHGAHCICVARVYFVTLDLANAWKG